MSTTGSAASRVPNNLRFRRTFGRIKKIIDIPNLIDIQKRSYEEFLQKDVAPEVRKDQGLQAVFKSVFPIKDFNETASLEFVSYTLSEPKYDVEECHQRGRSEERRVGEEGRSGEGEVVVKDVRQARYLS